MYKAQDHYTKYRHSKQSSLIFLSQLHGKINTFMQCGLHCGIHNPMLVIPMDNTARLFFCVTCLFRACIYLPNGKAAIKNKMDTNNMVLGIDEYLPQNRKDKEIEFIAFKKYFQRIFKGTGAYYQKYLEQIKEEFSQAAAAGQKVPMHNLIIFGHSLDVTDKDILQELITFDHIFTTIFYVDKDDLAKKIANLVKIIGQKQLIKRTGGGNTRTIVFKQLKEMKKDEYKCFKI